MILKDKKYIPNKGILVGTFSLDDIIKGIDKTAVENASKETGYKYTNSEYVVENGEICALKVYVCSLDDVDLRLKW